MIRADDLTRPNWQCIHFSEASEISLALQRFADTGLAVIRVNVKEVDSEQEFLARIALAM